MKNALVLTAALLVVATSGCSSVQSVTDEAMGGSVVHNVGAEMTVDDLRVGDCLNDKVSADETSDLSDGVTALPLVSCAGYFDSQVFYIDMLDGSNAEYPGDDALNARIGALCDAKFEAFVGVAPADSTLGITWYLPTDEAWAAGDKGFDCTVYSVGERGTGTKTHGTLRGSKL